MNRKVRDDDISGVTPQVVRLLGLALVALTLILRGGMALRGLEQFSDDPDAYRALAETIAADGVYGISRENPTAFRPPLYPWVLSWIVSDGRLTNPSVAILHVVLAAATVWLTFRAAILILLRDHSVVVSRHALFGGVVAALVVLCDPILLRQSTLLMTETMAACLVAAVNWWWIRRVANRPNIFSGVVLGTLLVLAYLCRPTFLVWAAFLIVGLAMNQLRESRRLKRGRRSDATASQSGQRRDWAWAMAGVAAASVLACAVGAWMYRNARVVGHPVWATTHGGYTLLLGNNPFFYDYLRSGDRGETWQAEPFLVAYSHRYDADPRTREFWETSWPEMRLVQSEQVQREATEHSDDQLAYESAKAVIGRNPSMFVYSCLVRAYRLWKPFPYQTEGRGRTGVIVVGVYYCFLYLMASYGLFKLWRQPNRFRWWSTLALLLTLTSVHAVYWSNLRMRAPAIPALALLVGSAVGLPRDRPSSPHQEADSSCGAR